MASTEFRFTSTDGLRIACVRWDSRGAPRGVAQIAHGMGEHIGRYVGTIEVLVSAGLTVYGQDHRGHGRTAPSAACFGDFGAGGPPFTVNVSTPVASDVRPRNGREALIGRYHKAGIDDVAHDYYPGGRHEMLNEISRGEVRARLLGWYSSVRRPWSRRSRCR